MKRFLKNLLLAQTASDAGKGFYTKGHNSFNAQAKGYSLKDQYIDQAIENLHPGEGLVYYSNGIIYFETPWGQMSFHTFGNGYIDKLENHPCWSPIEGNGKVGGSLATAKRIEKRFNFQIR